MATTGIEKELYPFSTEDSKAIPLDVIRPLSLFKRAFLAAGQTVLTIPVGWKVAAFYSSTGCMIQFAASSLVGPPADGTVYPDTLFIPPNCVVTATVLEGAGTVVSLAGVAGYVVVQQIQKWSGLALKRQISTR